MATSQLSPRQLKFAEGVLAGKIPKDAYLEAGYRARGLSAHSAAHRMLKNDDISAFLNSANAKAIAKAELSAEWVLERLKQIASGDRASAVRALELLGKHLGLWKDGPAVTVNAVQFDYSKLTDSELDTLSELIERTEVAAN